MLFNIKIRAHIPTACFTTAGTKVRKARIWIHYNLLQSTDTILIPLFFVGSFFGFRKAIHKILKSTVQRESKMVAMVLAGTKQKQEEQHDVLLDPVPNPLRFLTEIHAEEDRQRQAAAAAAVVAAAAACKKTSLTTSPLPTAGVVRQISAEQTKMMRTMTTTKDIIVSADSSPSSTMQLQWQRQLDQKIDSDTPMTVSRSGSSSSSSSSSSSEGDDHAEMMDDDTIVSIMNDPSLWLNLPPPLPSHYSNFHGDGSMMIPTFFDAVATTCPSSSLFIFDDNKNDETHHHHYHNHPPINMMKLNDDLQALAAAGGMSSVPIVASCSRSASPDLHQYHDDHSFDVHDDHPCMLLSPSLLGPSDSSSSNNTTAMAAAAAAVTGTTFIGEEDGNGNTTAMMLSSSSSFDSLSAVAIAAAAAALGGGRAVTAMDAHPVPSSCVPTTTFSNDGVLTLQQQQQLHQKRHGLKNGEKASSSKVIKKKKKKRKSPSSSSSSSSNSTTTTTATTTATNGTKRVGDSKKVYLGTEVVEYLKRWMMSPEHVDHPYPTDEEKLQIMADTGIEPKQLTNWFVNNRRRFWRPRVEHKQTKGSSSASSANSASPSTTTTTKNPKNKYSESSSSKYNGKKLKIMKQQKSKPKPSLPPSFLMKIDTAATPEKCT